MASSWAVMKPGERWDGEAGRGWPLSLPFTTPSTSLMLGWGRGLAVGWWEEGGGEACWWGLIAAGQGQVSGPYHIVLALY